MRHLPPLLAALLALSTGMPVVAQENTPVMRYELKAPILFSAPTGTDPGDDDGTPPGGGSSEPLSIVKGAGFTDWATVGDPFGPISITGGVPSYTIGLHDGILPQGLQPQGATIGGFYSEEGLYTFRLKATDSATPTPTTRISDPISVDVDYPVSIGSYAQPTVAATVGTAVTIPAPAAAGGTPPYAFTATPSVPGFDTGNGSIAFTPSTTGDIGPIQLSVTDSRGRPAATSATPLTISVSSPLSASFSGSPYALRVGVAASLPAPTIIGGRGGKTLTPSGDFPAGVTPASDGSGSGTPTADGSGSYTYLITDADGRQATASATWSVVPALTIQGVNAIYSGMVQQSFSGIFPTAPSAQGTATWTLATGTLPSGLSLNGSSGAITGTLTLNATTQTGLSLRVTDSLGSTVSSTFSINVTSDIEATVSANTQNIALPGSYFSTTDWQGALPKRLVIPAGVTVYSLSPAIPALDTGSGYGGTLTIEVRGNVYGAGGLGTTGVGGNGGTAILTSTDATIANYGTIKGGGGAGGAGGKGGDAGGWNTTGTQQTRTVSTGNPASYCYRNGDKTQPVTSMYWDGISLGGLGGAAGISRDIVTGSGSPYRYSCSSSTSLYYVGINRYQLVYNVTATGGNGGKGGNGESFGVAAQNGLTGSPGGVNAGSGGTGGAGGLLGLGGNNGSTGSNGQTAGTTGSTAGLAGYAIQGPGIYSAQGGTKTGR